MRKRVVLSVAAVVLANTGTAHADSLVLHMGDSGDGVLRVYVYEEGETDGRRSIASLVRFTGSADAVEFDLPAGRYRIIAHLFEDRERIAETDESVTVGDDAHSYAIDFTSKPD